MYIYTHAHIYVYIISAIYLAYMKPYEVYTCNAIIYLAVFIFINQI